MDVLVVGGKGMLGSDLVSHVRSRGWETASLDLPDFDGLNPDCVARLSDGAYGKPNWIVNCAAYTAVDAAESEVDLAFRLNAELPRMIASCAKALGARFLQIGTDFVFDGQAAGWYSEDASTNPLSVYGASKMEGETAATSALADTVVCRTAWLYGPHGKSFPRTILAAWQKGSQLRVVSDQVGCPTYTGDLSRVLADLIAADAPGGIYHTAGSEESSWHCLAQSVLQVAHQEGWQGPWPADVLPIASADWPTPARRPMNSRLSFAKCAGLGIAPMRPTRECLTEFLDRLKSGQS